jgi:hypothetical protein
MEGIKRQVIRLIEALPEGVSLDEIMAELYFKMQVDAGCVLSRENPEKNQKASRILSSGIPGNYHQPVLAV